jgi:hypothetical protein
LATVVFCVVALARFATMRAVLSALKRLFWCIVVQPTNDGEGATMAKEQRWRRSNDGFAYHGDPSLGLHPHLLARQAARADCDDDIRQPSVLNLFMRSPGSNVVAA